MQYIIVYQYRMGSSLTWVFKPPRLLWTQSFAELSAISGAMGKGPSTAIGQFQICLLLIGLHHLFNGKHLTVARTFATVSCGCGAPLRDAIACRCVQMSHLAWRKWGGFGRCFLVFHLPCALGKKNCNYTRVSHFVRVQYMLSQMLVKKYHTCCPFGFCQGANATFPKANPGIHPAPVEFQWRRP